MAMQTIGDVKREGNSYSGANVSGDITINGQAPRNGGQVSAQNLAAADNLDRPRGLIAYAALNPPANLPKNTVPLIQAATMAHSGNSWSAQNALRNAQVSASSIMNNGGRWDQHKGVSPERAYAAAMENADFAARGAQPGMVQAAMRENAATQREGMQQEGASRRSLVQAMLEQEKARKTAQRQANQDGIARQRLELETERISRAGVPSGYRNKTDGTLEAIPGGPADLKNSKEAAQQGKDASDVISILNQARPLLNNATGSYAGTAVDKAAQVFGLSTTGAEAGAQLKALQGALVSKMPKMSGPQSDKDVLLYREMAGQIGDPTIPANQRLAAMKTVEELHRKYVPQTDVAGQPQQQPQAQQPQQRTVSRTGTINGRRVVQYSDGSVDYAD